MAMAAIVLGIVGLLLGTGLAVAYSKLSVKVDEREQAVFEALPGANCGGCGFPGCAGFADAVVHGVAPVNGCVAGGPKVARKVAQILGRVVVESEPITARILCQAKTQDKYIYDGVKDCRAAALMGGGERDCQYACLGYGTCATVCHFGAITPHKDRTPPDIDENICVGCGKCVEMCPKHVITLVPKSQRVVVRCSSLAPGPETKKTSEDGCLGCRICERNCPAHAIKITNNLAAIDYDKCMQCGICVTKCPRGCIDLRIPLPSRFAAINPKKCTNCGKCVPACPTNAIQTVGDGDEARPVVFPAMCTGCQTCVKTCPEQGAITIKESKSKTAVAAK